MKTDNKSSWQYPQRNAYSIRQSFLYTTSVNMFLESGRGFMKTTAVSLFTSIIYDQKSNKTYPSEEIFARAALHKAKCRSTVLAKEGGVIYSRLPAYSQKYLAQAQRPRPTHSHCCPPSFTIVNDAIRSGIYAELMLTHQQKAAITLDMA